MSVILVCPACRSPIVLRRKAATTCPECGQWLEAALADVAASALRRERPLLIELGLLLSWIAGGFFALTCLSLIPGCPTILEVDGEPVTHVEWCRRVGPFLVLGAALLLGIARAFSTDRPWSRHLVLAFWLLALAVWWTNTTTRDEGDSFDMTTPLGALVAAWYFYFKANVVGYYRELHAERAG